MMKQCLTLLLATGILLLAGCSKESDLVDKGAGLQFENAWIREAPPGMAMSAGYFTAKNHGREDVAVLSASSESFGAIELHKTVIEAGTARMIEQEKLPIPAGGSLELTPGSYHMMLMMPSRPLKAEDHVTITLNMEDNSTHAIDFTVRKEGSGSH